MSSLASVMESHAVHGLVSTVGCNSPAAPFLQGMLSIGIDKVAMNEDAQKLLWTMDIEKAFVEMDSEPQRRFVKIIRAAHDMYIPKQNAKQLSHMLRTSRATIPHAWKEQVCRDGYRMGLVLRTGFGMRFYGMDEQ